MASDRRPGCWLRAARHAVISCALVLCAAACGDDGSDGTRAGDPAAERDAAGPRDAAARDAGTRPGPGETGELLDDLGLFTDTVAQEPADGVIAYDVNAVLYADETEKLRFMALPDGEAAEYHPSEMWSYPEGTRFVKTFYVPNDARDPERGRRLLETRIVELRSGTWTGRTYVWNDAQTEARRLKTGRTLALSWLGADGEPRDVDYRVPNDNECKTCHSRDRVFEPLGPRTRQLSRDGQLERFAQLGVLRGELDPVAERFMLIDPYGSGELDARARSYLDANCAHCHRPGGEAGSSALDLRYETREPYAWGVCRAPVAAGPGSGGRRHDIVAGDPDASIMVFRMASTDPKIKMPELPTVTSDAAGTQLIREWIAAMPSAPCD
jgi:uncharacterized repeat protein (TIGR03806 family)